MSVAVAVDVHLAAPDWAEVLATEVRGGLTGSPKVLSPVWFYDERGSELFDEITRLDEYYPTRAERSILEAHAGEIACRSGATTLVELGSGTSDKTRLLLDAMAEAGTLERFVPFDVSEETLRTAAASIAGEYELDVRAVVGDFHRHLRLIPRQGRRLIAFLGGTVGNLDPMKRRGFFDDLRAAMDDDEWLLLGTDLVKDPGRLVAAYDDAEGVTAEFNRNMLRVLDRELDADFDPTAFDHVALWNAEESWIEMRLRSRRDQQVHVDQLDLDVTFAEGEDLWTEISAKFTREGLRQELGRSGFEVEAAWTDPAGDFLLTLARPA
ncbi:MAG TPA: L-histidine N(alpha)-methyltransferase [Acidimicrobiales bacterium]